jgi:hypothetical protein
LRAGKVPEIKQIAEQLQSALDAARAENERLETANAQASARAEDAQRHADESEKKLHIAENLREKEYRAVISELFERPSRRAARLTISVAAVTTFAGIAATLYTANLQQRDMQLLIRATLSGNAAASGPANANRAPIVIDAANNRALGLSVDAGHFIDFRIPATSRDRMVVRARAVSGDLQLSAWQDSQTQLLCNGGGVGATQASCAFKPLHIGDVVVRVRASKTSVIQVWWQ